MIRNRNRPKFTKSQCAKGGSVIRGYETEEDAWRRSLIDSKGSVLRCGMSFTSAYPAGKPWQKRRALYGRTDQVEILFDGGIVLTTGESLLTGKWRFLRK